MTTTDLSLYAAAREAIEENECNSHPIAVQAYARAEQRCGDSPTCNQVMHHLDTMAEAPTAAQCVVNSHDYIEEAKQAVQDSYPHWTTGFRKEVLYLVSNSNLPSLFDEEPQLDELHPDYPRSVMTEEQAHEITMSEIMQQDDASPRAYDNTYPDYSDCYPDPWAGDYAHIVEGGA